MRFATWVDPGTGLVHYVAAALSDANYNPWLLTSCGIDRSNTQVDLPVVRVATCLTCVTDKQHKMTISDVFDRSLSA